MGSLAGFQVFQYLPSIEVDYEYFYLDCRSREAYNKLALEGSIWVDPIIWQRENIKEREVFVKDIYNLQNQFKSKNIAAQFIILGLNEMITPPPFSTNLDFFPPLTNFPSSANENQSTPHQKPCNNKALKSRISVKISNIFNRSKLKLKRSREVFLSPENSPTTPQTVYSLNAYHCLRLLLNNNIFNISVFPLKIEDIEKYFKFLESSVNESLSKMQRQFKECRGLMLINREETSLKIEQSNQNASYSSKNEESPQAKNQQDSAQLLERQEKVKVRDNSQKRKERRSILPSLKFRMKKTNSAKEEDDQDKDIWTTQDLQEDLVEIEDFENEIFSSTSNFTDGSSSVEATHQRKLTSSMSNIKYKDADPEEKSQSLLQEMDEIIRERQRQKKKSSLIQVFTSNRKL